MCNEILNDALLKILKGADRTINQNILLLIPALSALGFGEYYEICFLIIFGLILSTVATISVAFTFYAYTCLLYTSPSPRDGATSRMPSSA